MSGHTNPELDQILAEVSRAGRADRISYRDRVAAFGTDAILALEPWLADRELTAFAIRTIGRAASSDQPLAVKVLRDALATADNPAVCADLREELRRLGVNASGQAATSRSKQKPVARNRTETDATAALGDLVRGRVYKRSELHASGLGGNVQKGISYPAGGEHVLLFSNPSRISETGYHDRWADGGTFIYFGEWDGRGDMQMTGGNVRIVERSPELHVFVALGVGYAYEGRFECEGHGLERTLRDGAPATAIVFRLRRAQ